MDVNAVTRTERARRALLKKLNAIYLTRKVDVLHTQAGWELDMI